MDEITGRCTGCGGPLRVPQQPAALSEQALTESPRNRRRYGRRKRKGEGCTVRSGLLRRQRGSHQATHQHDLVVDCLDHHRHRRRGPFLLEAHLPSFRFITDFVDDRRALRFSAMQFLFGGSGSYVF
jgi:hypothetical protein